MIQTLTQLSEMYLRVEIKEILLCKDIFRKFSNVNVLVYNGIFPSRVIGEVLVPALGEDGGDKKVVDDPARTAEYRTDSTVVSIPRTRVLVDTTFVLLRPLHA